MGWDKKDGRTSNGLNEGGEVGFFVLGLEFQDSIELVKVAELS